VKKVEELAKIYSEPPEVDKIHGRLGDARLSESPIHKNTDDIYNK